MWQNELIIKKVVHFYEFIENLFMFSYFVIYIFYYGKRDDFYWFNLKRNLYKLYTLLFSFEIILICSHLEILIIFGLFFLILFIKYFKNSNLNISKMRKN